MIDTISSRMDAVATIDEGTLDKANFGRITKTQAKALLTRLISDEAFRATFERTPIVALEQFGLPMAQIATLRRDCISPRMLASNDALAQARERLAFDIEEGPDTFFIPTVKI